MKPQNTQTVFESSVINIYDIDEKMRHNVIY
jgi:hypothetical protein